MCNEIAKPPIATYHWYRLDTDLVSLPTIDSTPLVKEPLVTNVCSLQSSTVPLCGMFAYGHLVILSEADVVSCVDKDKRTDDSNSEVDSATENVPQGHQVEETEEEDSFAGLGFTTGKEERSTLQLEYQTEGDVTVTVALPDDVTKRDVHCVIERRMLVVGLTDGTTYFRGHLFAPVTPDCSTWTIENHRYVYSEFTVCCTCALYIMMCTTFITLMSLCTNRLTLVEANQTVVFLRTRDPFGPALLT